MQLRYQNRQQTVEITLERAGEVFQAVVNGETFAVEVLDSQPGFLSLKVNNRPMTFHWAQDGSRKWISQGGCTYWLDPPSQRGGRPVAEADGATAVRSPMPAQVRAVQVSSGDPVERGQMLMLLEAMKMEIQIKAPAAGRVKRLLAAAGQTVERDQVLIEIGE